ncbi:hypothetical protein ACJMK2_018835 [Sinanodonta woodiana]|uniref:THD domain-containing protein n=1 Tax=Sinanodonta woodiana TaxID=1069815 RepID=A0ABD3UG85_SINWO
MTDQEKDCAKNLLNNGMPNTNSVSTADLRRIKRCLYGLTVVVAAGDVILIVVVAVLFGNLKHDIENHTHKPKVGEQINKILKREELCLPCDQIRLGPSLEEDMMLDAFVRKHSTDGEQCCVETPSQLLRMLELFVERKYRQEMAKGNIKLTSSSPAEQSDEKRPVAHLMGSVQRPELPSVPGRQFPISQWIYDEDLAFYNLVSYRHGRIVILTPGLYYVYSQVSFLEMFGIGSNTAETGSQSLSHYLYRYNIVYPNGGEETLIQNSITKCWGQNKNFGEYTSYLGAIFQLRQGDELFVKVSNLSLIVRDPKQNYFGVFKL